MRPRKTSSARFRAIGHYYNDVHGKNQIYAINLPPLGENKQVNSEELVLPIVIM